MYVHSLIKVYVIRLQYRDTTLMNLLWLFDSRSESFRIYLFFENIDWTFKSINYLFSVYGTVTNTLIITYGWLEKKLLVSDVGSIGDHWRLQDHILVVGSHFTCGNSSSMTSNGMNAEFKVDPEVQTMEESLSSSCTSNFLMELVIDVNL